MLACAIVCGVSIVAWLAPEEAGAHTATATREIAVTTGAPTLNIAPDFFALSIEYTELRTYVGQGRLFDRMLSLMRAQNGARALFRLGGTTADEVYWNTSEPRPGFVTNLQPDWLAELAGLARRDRLRVELTLNLAVHSPAMAVAFAQSARRALPPGGLAALAVGNEPDLFRRQPRYQHERVSSTLASTPSDWTNGYSASRYSEDYRAYALSLKDALPHVPLIAPELTFPSVVWPDDLLGLGRLSPGILSVHRYAAATCSPGQRLREPTPASFLSDRYSVGLAKTLKNEIALAKAQGIPLRVTEMNSISCSQNSHIASSFSTSLWALGALFQMIKAGVGGINWHIRPDLPNSPYHVDANGRLQPLPELYGLVLFGKLLGPHAKLMRVRVARSARSAIEAWAVKSSTGLRTLLINRSSHAIRVLLHVSNAAGKMLLSRLSAPSLGSSTGITFAGQSLGPTGRWQGTRKTTVIHPKLGGYKLRLPPFSAAMAWVG